MTDSVSNICFTFVRFASCVPPPAMAMGWGGPEGSSVMRERETGGWAQFDWMLDGGSLKTQPIGSQLDSLKKANRWLRT